ncbi:MAG: hypothetical protein IJ237_09580 [Oscillospiraceae bacterium]|nr:hypothetical protein [Oscillospiraceae bacterium]
MMFGKRSLRSVALLLLTALFLMLLALPAGAEEKDGWVSEDEIGDQTIALGMAAWLNGVENTWRTDLVLWDAAGWYAALQYRVSGQALLQESEVRDFLTSAGYEGDYVLPPDWEEYGIVNVVRGAGNSRNFDFRQHKDMFDAMIGVTTEMNVSVTGPETVVFKAISHPFERERENAFLITFAENDRTSSKFSHKIIAVEKYQEQPKWDNTLNFTWEDLMEANLLSNILKWNSSVRISMPAIDADAQQWTFRHNGEIVQITDCGTYCFGSYGMYSFETMTSTDGVIRPCVGYVNYDPLEIEYLEKTVQRYLEGYESVEFLREENDQIWIRLTHEAGFHMDAAVDKGTLVIREVAFYYQGSSEPTSGNTLVYTEEPPAFEALKGWDQPLRSITAIWETFDPSTGQFAYRTEALQLPYNWEYYPNDARYGDYEIYTNPRYVGSYQYPGDLVDYSIFLTTAKG